MRGRSRRKKRTGKMVSLQKRFLAFMLAFAMIFTNVGTDLHVSFAASGNKVDFTIGGADLVDAIRQAIEDENVVSQDSLDFTDGATEKFEALFFGDGKVYEVYPDIQGDSMEAELRVFVKLPADADDTYMVTGEEEVYFLYVNNGEDTISCSTTVTRTENGKEKEKTTKRITIKSYEDKFGDEERNIISKPAETAPAEKPSEAVNEETTENVVNPTDAEKETTAAEETAEVPETKEDVEESKEQPEETKEEETEAATEAPEEITEPETEEAAETEAAESETEASEPEAEAPAEEPAQEGEVTASISRHGVPLVAMKEDVADAADGAEPTEPEKEEAAEATEPVKEEKAEELKKEEASEPETAPETEAETTVEETTAEETTAEETTAEAEKESRPEGPAGEETTETPAETEPEVPVDPGETTVPEETPESTEPETEPAQPAETTAAIPETLPAPQPEVPAKTADDGDLVGIGYCSTAKVYKSTLNALRVFDSEIVLSAEVAGAEGVTVKLTALSDVLPENGYIEANAVEDEDQLELMKAAADDILKAENRRVTDLFAADITLYNEDGEAVQPDGSVKVTFEGTAIGNSGTRVLYMGENASDAETYDAQMIKAVAAEGDATAFMTDYFSLYIAADTEEITCHAVNFYYKDAEEKDVLISGPQYVEDGKAAQAPAVPDRDGYMFTGWDTDFSKVTGDMDIYAGYAPIAGQVRLTVNYVYSNGSLAAQPWVSHVESGVSCNLTAESPAIQGFTPDQTSVSFNDAYTTDQTVNVTYKGAIVNYTVNHYLLNVDDRKPATPADTEIVPGETGLTTEAKAKEYAGFTPQAISQATVNADGSTVVEILYERNYYTLTWNTGENASYIAPEQVRYGAAVTKPDKDPTKVGYEFKGWENLPETMTMPAEDLVVTAKWEAAKSAAYKIIYWTETVKEGVYTVNHVINGTGTVGNSIPDGSYTVPKGYKTTPVEGKTDVDVKITADGTAVKNVYYARDTYTIKFMRQYRDGWSWTWAEDESLRIIARYGVDVSAKWEKACANAGWGPNSSGNIQYTLLANMPAENLTMYEKNAGNGKYIIYYVEDLNGNWKEYRKFPAASGVYLTDEDKMPITGFTFKEWKKQGSKRDNLWLRYSRNSYKLFFENCQPMNPISIKFEAQLSTGRPPQDPGRPSYVDSDYTFAGWYLDPGFKEPVDWDETMTEDGLTIYAKWEKPKYTVNFVTNCEESKDSITREKGFVLTGEELAAPDKADDEFLGWYTDSALTKKFIPESQIVKDTTLYARWKNSDTVTYTVKYMYGNVEIATAKKQPVTRNSTVSEPAETVEGYYPETLSISAMITSEGQEIIFKYRAVQSWTYTVKYLLEGTETEVPGSTVETGTTSDQNVMITFKTFEGYTLKSDPVQKVTQENPEVIFYYVPKTAIYHIQHWYERLDGTFGLRYIDTFNTAAGQFVTTEEKDNRPVAGFTLDTSITGTVTEGITDIQNVLSLKLYYSRNTHQVSYQYEGDVPTGAPAVPDVANHKYQAQVAVAENPNVTGYIFSGWTAATENGTAVTTTGGKFVMPDANVVLKGSFKAAEQTYRVKYLDEDKNVEIRDMSDPRDAHFGDVIEGYTEKIEISGYTFVRADDLTVGTDNEQNIVNVYYSEDTNEDDIPDKYQITFTYVSADADKGTVTGITSEIVTVQTIQRDEVTGVITAVSEKTPQHPTQPSTVKAETGYKFDKWTDNAGKSFNDDTALEAESYLEDQTFTAYFKATEQTYRVKYLDEDTKEEIQAMSDPKDAHFGDEIKGYTEKIEISGYTFVRADDLTVGTDNEQNIVNVYYSEDTNEDDIPDKYQITFTYVSADADKGTVTGTTSEVVTTYEITRDSVTGEITATNGPTAQHPTQPSTVTAKAGYKFDKWTDEDQKSFDDDTALKAASYLEDQTFTAYFKATEQTYRVKYLDEDTKEEIQAMSDPKDAHFGDEIKGYTEKIEISGYTFVRADDLTVGTDNEQNIVNVYYSEDTNEDDIPDKYQITFTYVSADDDKGTVTGTTSEIATVYEIFRDSETGEITELGPQTPQHPTQPSTVTPKDGYRFEKWQQDDLTFFNSDDELRNSEYLEDQTFIAHFTVRRDLHYEIHYFYEDANGVVTEDTAAAIVSDIGVFGEKILTTTVAKESEFNGKHYVLERIIGAEKRIGLDPDENIVNVYYSIDVIGKEDPDKPDNIPDKYQITFTYVSADEDKGTVTGITREVATVYEIFTDSETGEITDVGRPIPQHPTQPSTVTPKDGYRFEKWQQDDLTFFNSDDELRNSEYLEDQTFIAHFTVRRDLHYEIHYFYEDANGVVTEDTAAAIVSDIGVFGEKILTTTVPKESEFNGKNYVLERIEGADKQIGLDPKENMVNVYYSMDEIGEIDPDEPDNIPDKYQVTFQYISEDPSYGTVSGKVKEVVTRPKNADGTYNMTAPVHPKAEVTVAGIGNYKFNRWSDGNTNYSAASEIAKAGFIADTTFTAYFSYSGGNSGGGSSGGGGGGSHRSTISNTSGGPGVTTTITPGDVPMAELPESPAPIVIDDGEIPMAALPKTGQTTVKAALTMMFSGIFLALTAIGRKKKEQDV